MKRLRTAALATALLGVLTAVPHHSALAGQSIDPMTLNPAAPPPYTCMATGGGAICTYTIYETHTMEDTGLTCDAGSYTFEMLNSYDYKRTATRYYDTSGNLTRRVRHEYYSNALAINSVTGKSFRWQQTDTITEVLAVPGDLSTATVTNVGSNIFHAPGYGLLGGSAGRLVTDPDGDLIFQAGFSDFLTDADFAAFVQRQCAALS